MSEERYNRIRKIGEGGMGEVWLVMDNDSRALFAQKVLRPPLAREKDLVRFKREIEALSKLRHENIIRIREVVESESTLSYVMEYCPDGNLLEFLSRNENEEALPFVVQVAKAVDHIHEAGLIHRDIKPQNILVGADGKARLTDFGLVIESDPKREIVTTSNWLSPGFAPPEQYRDMTHVTARGDIFSIGAVWFFLLRGKTFAIDESLDEQIRPLNPLQKFVFRRTLAHNPSDRLESAAEIVGILEEAQSERLLPFFELAPKDRLKTIDERFEQCCDQKDWVDGWDISEMASVTDFLEAVLKYEDDEDVLSQAGSHLATLECELRRIVAEMKQDNP
jgi:serine/threonine-protein kinase